MKSISFSSTNATSKFYEIQQKYVVSIKDKWDIKKTGPDHLPTFTATCTIEFDYGGKHFKIEETSQGKDKKSSKHNCFEKINKKLLEILNSEANSEGMKNLKLVDEEKMEVERDEKANIPMSPYKLRSSEVYFTKPDNKGLLGTGGFSNVFCVVQKDKESKLLALKVPKMEESEHDKKKFDKELELHLKAQNNEFVAKIFGTTYVRNRRALVMEYCPRGTLLDLVRGTNWDIGPSMICRIHRDIGEAIKYLHGKGEKHRITHNDLKPNNVLMTTDFRARLCDFGGSSIATQTTLRSAERPHYSAAYTAFFVAPERDRHPEKVPGKPNDIYSFGVCLYTSLCPVKYEKNRRFYLQFEHFKRTTTKPIRQRLSELEKNETGDNFNEANILYEMLQLIKVCSAQNVEERPKIEEICNQIELCCRVNNVEKLAMNAEKVLKVKLQLKEYAYDGTWVSIDNLKV